jgi:superfamily II DNA or RNA helicase
MNKKIEKRVTDMFLNNQFDEDFANINLTEIVSRNVLSYQILHLLNLVAALKKGKVSVVDGSTTGTGKTYTAIASCAQLGLRPFIICPRTAMSMWATVCEIFNVKPIAIVNYETIKNAQTYDDNMKRMPSVHLTKDNKKYVWNFGKLTDSAVIIFDEAHKCKNDKSLNGKLMMASKNACRVMLLSATLCDKPDDFIVFGYMLDFYNTLKKGKNWIKGVVRDDLNKFGKESSLSKHIFPHKGSKMSLEDLGTEIPRNIISSDCYTIEKKYAKKINAEYEALKNIIGTATQLTAISHARQKIEEYKVPILLELSDSYIEQNKSVVIFVNFVNTLNLLKTEFDASDIQYSTIVGGQSILERERQIKSFQDNEVKVILIMMQAGGESINLHDTSGRHPRVSLISPSMSSIELVQALGRTYRTGIKSVVVQKLIFCDKTYEVNISKMIKSKLKFLDKLTDDDFMKF